MPAAKTCGIALLFVSAGLHLVLGQAKEPSPVFNSALNDIRGKTQIPILLPSRLPWPDAETAIKLATGDARDEGYFIALYFSVQGSNASYAAGFGALKGNRMPSRGTRKVTFAGDRSGWFKAVSCGGSSAPPTCGGYKMA